MSIDDKVKKPQILLDSQQAIKKEQERIKQTRSYSIIAEAKERINYHQDLIHEIGEKYQWAWIYQR